MAFAKTSVAYWDELLYQDLLPKSQITAGKREDIREPLFVGQIAALCHQLASVSEAASDMFSNISKSLEQLDERIGRVGEIANDTEAEMNSVLQRNLDIGKTNPISMVQTKGVESDKVDTLIDNLEVDFSDLTRPEPIAQKYSSCNDLPDFSEINKLGMSRTPANELYSNPGFFVDHWVKSIEEKHAKDKQERKERKKRRKEAKGKKKKEEKKAVAQLEKKQFSAHGAELAGLHLRQDKGKVLVDADEVNFIAIDPVLPCFLMEGDDEVVMPRAPTEQVEQSSTVTPTEAPASTPTLTAAPASTQPRRRTRELELIAEDDDSAYVETAPPPPTVAPPPPPAVPPTTTTTATTASPAASTPAPPPPPPAAASFTPPPPPPPPSGAP
eukprot:CAMPEP_0113890020 /NCGR_PEP_ID=MMETSP0780_2-20120614/13873_1 /TAXON_ID=652834 /ORGANISM="Palpitomonas bilix" /LENGTH=384 /DNA_ID=CAMNT_0000879289 /DNA_START=23 /DNA_END=1174 /DNA_ORIENTATION=- /assembly_acc=CAM_ASM_000599